MRELPRRRSRSVRTVTATVVAGVVTLIVTVTTSEGVVHAFVMPHV
jgi:hypothetical protein